MQKVRAKAEARDEDERLERDIRLEDNERDEPGKNCDDAERQDVAVSGKDAGLDGHEVNGEDYRIAYDEEDVGILGQDPFPECSFENEEEKIEPDQPFGMDDQPWVSL
jgi:hypothetical protein